MYVCLRLPPLRRTLAPKRGQMVSWPPLLRVPKHAGVHRAAHLCWWGEHRGMGGRSEVLSDWLIGVVVLRCVSVPDVEEQPPYGLQPPHQTHKDRLCLEKPRYHADALVLLDSLPRQERGPSSKLTVIGHYWGRCKTKPLCITQVLPHTFKLNVCVFTLSPFFPVSLGALAHAWLEQSCSSHIFSKQSGIMRAVACTHTGK